MCDACGFFHTILHAIPIVQTLEKSPHTQHWVGDSTDSKLLIYNVSRVVALTPHDDAVANLCRYSCTQCTLMFFKTHLIPDPWDKQCRLGEAKNPGPCDMFPADNVFVPSNALRIGILNPSGMYQKSEHIASLGSGVWAIAETKATTKLQKVLRNEFKRMEHNVDFCNPVPQCSQTRHDAFRGVSSGVACVTHFPIRSVTNNHPDNILQSNRFLSTVVSLGPNTTMLVVTIYAPPPTNQTIGDPVALTGDLINHAVQTVTEWRGPAVIVGDFNQEIENMQSVQRLLQKGWRDAQDLSVEIHGHPKRPTCITHAGTSCHSKIFCSPEFASCMYHCNAWDDNLFANHPTLVMSCNLEHFAQPSVQWHLPKPFVCKSFDHESFNSLEPSIDSSFQREFDQALSSKDIEQTARIWVRHTEKALAISARDEEGHPINFSSNHFGRSKGPTFKKRPSAIPVIHSARDGEYTPKTVQGPVWFRQHLRQSRRLQTLVNLIRARDRNPTPANIETSESLWQSIIQAPGFVHGFPQWMVMNLGVVFPVHLPEQQTCVSISNTFHEYFKKCDLKFQRDARSHRQKVFDEDWSKGGSLTFAGIREDMIKPPCYVARTVTVNVTRVRWRKTGLTTIPCKQTGDIVVDHPITFQNQQVNVVDKQPGFIVVDRPLFLRSQNFTAMQQFFLFDKTEAVKEVVDTWNGFLQRDRDNLCEGWEDAENLAANIPQQPEITLPGFNYELWQRVQSTTPTHSARGACGFTVTEMRALPKWCILQLFSLLTLIEQNAQWPKFWLFAFTIMLPKTCTPESPLDLRPITILSRVYRQWSRYKAVALLVGLSNRLPSVIAGGTQMSAMMLNAHFQELLESELHDTETNGVTIDIVKCYNLIPRFPLSLFMAKLGWPLYLIRTYMAALIGLRRSFLVLNTVSDWHQSYTGVPEGCALAVAAMLTLSAALYHHLRLKSPDTNLFTFADNWALKFLRAAHTPMGIFALEEFCRSLRLRISVPKSWLWTLNNKTEKLVDGLRLQGTPIPVVKHVKDLGLDNTYRGKTKKDFQKKRLRLGLQRCARVNKQLHPAKQASRLILASCFPKAAYGVEIQMPTKKEFCSFRTSVARSIGLARKGASPWISLNLLDKNHDFEFYSQIRTIMFWRQYVKLFPARRNCVFEKLLSPKSRGPVTTLACLMQTWGQILPDGKFNSHFFGVISWTDCSKKFLKHVIHTHWVHSTCQHLVALPRKNFECNFVDVGGFTTILKKFDTVDQQIIRTHCSGTNYTNNVQAKYRDIPMDCPFCNTRDSRQHRILDCEGLREFRQHLSQDTMQLLQQNCTLSHFSLMPVQDQYLNIRLQLETVLHCPVLDDLIDNTIPIHAFTDGTCYHNVERQLALAGSAAAFFQSVGKAKPQEVVRQILPGCDHSSFRAEVFAFLIAISRFRRLIIYTDCQAAMGELVYLLDCINRQAEPSYQDHEDLWKIVFEVLKRNHNEIQVVKVKAHNENNFHNSSFEQWCSIANAFVDREAKMSIRVDHATLLHNFDTLHDEISKRRKSLHEILGFQVEVAKKSFDQRAHVNSLNDQQNVQGFVPPGPFEMYSNPLTLNDCQLCKFNPEFLMRLSSWASNVSWDLNTNETTSTFELMLSYIYSTGCYPPYPLRKYPDNANNRSIHWVLKDLHPTMDFQGFHCADLLSGFTRCVNWTKKHLQVSLFPDLPKPDVVSLTRYGFKGKTAGIRARALLPKQDMVDEYCNIHMCGKTCFRLPIP